jgi:hypothetical protein
VLPRTRITLNITFWEYIKGERSYSARQWACCGTQAGLLGVKQPKQQQIEIEFFFARLAVPPSTQTINSRFSSIGPAAMIQGPL